MSKEIRTEIRQEVLAFLKDLSNTRYNVPGRPYLNIKDVETACDKGIYLVDNSKIADEQTIASISFCSDLLRLSVRSMRPKYDRLIREVYSTLHTISHRELIKFDVEPRNLEAFL